MPGSSAWVRGARLVALLAGLGVLCLSVVSWALAGRARESAALDHELSLEVAQYVNTVDAYFERSRSISLLMAQNPVSTDFYAGPGSTEAKIRAGGPAVQRINAALAYLQRLYPGRVAEACLIDAGGQEIARVINGLAALPQQLSADESGSTFFAPTLALPFGQVYQARPYLSPDTNQWVISNSTLVHIPTGLSAIVHFEVTLDSFRAVPDSHHDDTFSLVDAETGAILVDSRAPQLVGAPLGRPGDDSFRSLTGQAATEGIVSTGDRRVAYHRIAPTPGNANAWLVIVSAPEVASAWSQGWGAGSLAMMLAAVATIAVAGASLRSYQRALQRAALHDPLTGLPNRTLLGDRLAQALRSADRSGERVAVLIIDLDRFKDVNDTLGHHLGDLLLTHVAARLAGTVRGADTIARLGGDEFAVLMPGIADSGAALAVAARVLAGLHDSFIVDGITLDIEASVGIAISPDHGNQAMQLMRRADVAMYMAKELKTGAVLYDSSHDVHAPARLTLLGDLRRALEADDQITLHYQPKVDLALGRLTGVEALVRWHHPEQGMLMPGQFLPVAESTALITKLTQRVLELAARQAREWANAGTPTPIAVNLSTRCLLDDTLPAAVQDLLSRHQLPATLLQLEITESTIMAQPARALGILRALHASGIRLSIDDFGTGYSSMAYLKELPVDELKVDRCFVKDMTTNPDDATLVRSAIDLAHNLGLAVVAEGVENQQTLDHLRDLGCDLAQGYHLGRPAPADHLQLGRPGPVAALDPGRPGTPVGGQPKTSA